MWNSAKKCATASTQPGAPSSGKKTPERKRIAAGSRRGYTWNPNAGTETRTISVVAAKPTSTVAASHAAT